METTGHFQATVRGDEPPFAGLSLDRSLPKIPGYEVLELIGRGGMGRVYRARHLGLGRIVALKLLSQEADEKLLARFREEARAVARLQHPNIAQLYETGSANGRPYFAQEFLDGGSLAQALAGRPQQPRDAAALLEVIARAVHHSHSEGILHRDLKPGNILLAKKSETRHSPPEHEEKKDELAAALNFEFRISNFIPKVADFGLAKTLDVRGVDTKPESGGALTRTGEILGTPSYMPPEQASGVVTNIGPAADVYALGAVLYELLTGRPPFQSAEPVQTLMMVLTREPVSPRSLQPDIPRDLETICLKCLEKSPKKRYDSARELADDLRRYLDGMPILARPVGLFERTAKWARRNKAVAALVAVSAIAGVMLLGAGVALTIGYFQLKKTNGDLETTNTTLDRVNREITEKKNELETTNTQLNQANSDITQKKNELERANADIERTLSFTFASLDRFFFEFSDSMNELPGAGPLRLEVLTQARRTLDSLAQFHPDHKTILDYQMTGYDRLGNIESTIGDVAAAEQSYTKSRDIAKKLEARFPGESKYKRSRVLATVKLSTLLQRRGEKKAGDTMMEAIGPEMNKLAVDEPDDPHVLEVLAIVRLHQFERLLRTSQWDEALVRMRELCELYRRQAKVEPNNPVRQRGVIDGDRQLALFLMSFDNADKLDEAGRLLMRAGMDADALPNRSSMTVRRLRANVQSTLGSYYEKRADNAKAIAAYTIAAAEYGSLAEKYTDRPIFRYEQARSLFYLAGPTRASGDTKAALAHLEKADKLLTELQSVSKSAVYRELQAFVRTTIKEIQTAPKSPDKKP